MTAFANYFRLKGAKKVFNGKIRKFALCLSAGSLTLLVKLIRNDPETSLPQRAQRTQSNMVSFV
jgi:hypothetical protein